MSKGSRNVKITRRGVLVAVVAIAVVVAWSLAFYLPETHKLQGLDAQQTSLHSIVVADQARLQRVKTEAAHVTQIKAMHQRLEGYVPASPDLYTYIHTISAAAKSAGVTITSLSPGGSVPVTGYSAIPITASVKGTYDQVVAFLKDLYALPRLTDINDVYISGGGPGTTRSTKLSVTLQLSIFTVLQSSTEPGS